MRSQACLRSHLIMMNDFNQHLARNDSIDLNHFFVADLVPATGAAQPSDECFFDFAIKR